MIPVIITFGVKSTAILYHNFRYVKMDLLVPQDTSIPNAITLVHTHESVYNSIKIVYAFDFGIGSAVLAIS